MLGEHLVHVLESGFLRWIAEVTDLREVLSQDPRDGLRWRCVGRLGRTGMMPVMRTRRRTLYINSIERITLLGGRFSFLGMSYSFMFLTSSGPTERFIAPLIYENLSITGPLSSPNVYFLDVKSAMFCSSVWEGVQVGVCGGNCSGEDLEAIVFRFETSSVPCAVSSRLARRNFRSQRRRGFGLRHSCCRDWLSRNRSNWILELGLVWRPDYVS